MQETMTLISAELEFAPQDDINARIAEVDRQLEKYTNQADRFDYALAVASGLLCGAVDALYVGEIKYVKRSIKWSNESVNRFIMDYAKAHHIDVDNLRLNRTIEKLEDVFKVPQDSPKVWNGKVPGVVPMNHHLADLAHHPTPVGLLSAIVVQFFRVGTFVNKEGEWHFVPIKTSLEDLARIWAPAVITGLLNWMVSISEETYEEKAEEVPESIHKLAHAFANAPLAIEIVKCADNWFGHLVSDMAGTKNKAGAGMGIPGVFMSLL